MLETTNDYASTVVGTPYYMSPEVCQSRPYTYKSDVWALGCVIYECCTFNHPFDAPHLMGLIFKITMEKPEPISDMYSKDLSNLIE